MTHIFLFAPISLYWDIRLPKVPSSLSSNDEPQDTLQSPLRSTHIQSPHLLAPTLSKGLSYFYSKNLVKELAVFSRFLLHLHQRAKHVAPVSSKMVYEQRTMCSAVGLSIRPLVSCSGHGKGKSIFSRLYFMWHLFWNVCFLSGTEVS